jgi:hypothetical protein
MGEKGSKEIASWWILKNFCTGNNKIVQITLLQFQIQNLKEMEATVLYKEFKTTVNFDGVCWEGRDCFGLLVGLTP